MSELHKRQSPYGRREPRRSSLTGPAEMSDKQEGFIRDLIEQVNLDEEEKFKALKALSYPKGDEDRLRMDQASRWIDRLLELKRTNPAPHVDRREQRRQEQSTGFADVPAGRYALDGNDGSVDFYQVDRPDKGFWTGCWFVKLLVAHGGFGGDLREQRLPIANQRTISERIESAGPEMAMRRFGHELGVCGHCGRNLTNDLSIKLGIGPVCRAKLGWGESHDFGPMTDLGGAPMSERPDLGGPESDSRPDDDYMTAGPPGPPPEGVPCMACGRLQSVDGECQCYV